LSCRQTMERHSKAYYSDRESRGIPVRYSHRMGEEQWEYLRWLAAETAGSPLPDWRPRMHKAGQANIRERPDSYRDSFPDQHLVEEVEGRVIVKAT
jgi:hypothetical protein